MKPNKPLISIITVVYNGEKYLEQTIQSVLNQTYTNIEYIIIDGKSTDKTLDIIKKYDNEISFWSSEPDKGIYDAMNKGIKKADGDYIGILNSDDYYELNAVEHIVNEISKFPDADVLFGNIYKLNMYFPEKILQNNMKGTNLTKGFSIWHPTTFVKQQIYTKHGLFDTSYKIAADYDLLLRFYLKNCKFQYINKVITNFREGGMSDYNNGTAQEQFRIHREHTTLWNAHFAKIKLQIKELLQKLFKKLLGKKNYHSIRYKFL